MKVKILFYAFVIVVFAFAIVIEHATAQTLCGIEIGSEGEAEFAIIGNGTIGNTYEVSASYFADDYKIIYQVNAEFADDLTPDEFSILLLSFSDHYDIDLTFYESIDVLDETYRAYIGMKNGVDYRVFYQEMGDNSELIANIVFAITDRNLDFYANAAE